MPVSSTGAGQIKRLKAACARLAGEVAALEGIKAAKDAEIERLHAALAEREDKMMDLVHEKDSEIVRLTKALRAALNEEVCAETLSEIAGQS